ncbi:MAG: helix-turn-helix transcriptional regulator [Ruminococcaceae bacterium]|nr:helix-turn-helix transcriptional regulator [Oscillospiraceae bacterium]
MKIIPFEELYNTEFFITEVLAKGQNWYTRNNYYSCITRPKPSHTLLWFKNCNAKITDKSGKVILVEKNQVAYMAKGLEYTVEFFDTAPNQDDSVVFHFQLKNKKGEEIAPTLSPKICIKSVDSTLAILIKSAAEEFSKNIVCTPIITAAIYQMLGNACKRQRRRVVNHKYKYISDGIELMENNADKTLTEIAEICGVSEGYFRRLFREYSGENPIEFRQKYRIEKAKQLLLSDENFSMAEIAEELHFSDIYHFSKVFKKFCGVSPSKFLQNQEK